MAMDRFALPGLPLREVVWGQEASSARGDVMKNENRSNRWKPKLMQKVGPACVRREVQ